jgi:hypothetical protein
MDTQKAQTSEHATVRIVRCRHHTIVTRDSVIGRNFLTVIQFLESMLFTRLVSRETPTSVTVATSLA